MSLITPSPSIVRREDFGALLNLRGLKGTAVEVGTHRGEFAEAFMEGWNGKLLCCVDPWCADIPGYVGQDSIALCDRNANYEETKKRLSPFGARVRLMRMLSTDAFKEFAADSLDFVYIDGNHQRPFIEQDLNLWYSRVRPGAILAGHDFNGDWEHTVRPAVLEFAERFAVGAVYVVPGDTASWYFVSP